VAWMGNKRNWFRVLMREPEGRRLLGKPRHKLEDNTKIGPKEIWWDSISWIHLA